MTSCFCCSACKPRYQRLVDNIFPSSQEEGLIRSEMEKLTYYAVSAPEKLNRIGVYLAKRLTRDIQRKRDKSVFIAMEALNLLLMACHAQQINLFIESFLKMVATLLESPNLAFQALGTNSFESFSKIEEDTPSYHRRYDFFVSKFSSMCHSNEKDQAERLKIQLHGVRGIRGVIRKTVSDELQVNIWEKQHMDKIIPSLLFSMQNDPNITLYEDGGPVPAEELGCPWVLAEESLRELLSRAAFANVPAAVAPALVHMDNHKLWAPDNLFAIKCFKIIMYSIQSQYTHVTVKMLLDHIDSNVNEHETVKASMLKVLCAIVPLPSCAIGPSVIDVFNRLSKHLKSLAKNQDQKKFESALIETTGVLASVVPDYQKLEIMSFYINKAHEALSGEGNLEELSKHSTVYANLLLQCLDNISNTYRATNNLSSLSSSLLEPLLKVALLADPHDRLFAQRVLISLLDKNLNYPKLRIVKDQTELDLSDLISSVPSKNDFDFLDRRLPNIYRWLVESFCLDDNTVENYIILFKCVVIICLSVTSSDVIIELCRLTLTVQNAAVDLYSGLSPGDSRIAHVCWIMAATACNMIYISHFSTISQFQSYVNDVLQARAKDLSEFSPNSLKSFTQTLTLNSEEMSEVVFSSNEIHNLLSGHSGFNVDKLNQPFLANLAQDSLSAELKRSAVDVESINIQLTSSHDQSLLEIDGLMPARAITFNYLKQVATQPPMSRAEQMAINEKAAEHIRSADFEQLLAEMKPNPAIKAFQRINELLSEEEFIPDEEYVAKEDFILPFVL